jgi:hypothetical protein
LRSTPSSVPPKAKPQAAKRLKRKCLGIFGM